jgi:hypothetical protein
MRQEAARFLRGSWTALMRHLGSFGSPVVNVASGE